MTSSKKKGKGKAVRKVVKKAVKKVRIAKKAVAKISKKAIKISKKAVKPVKKAVKPAILPTGVANLLITFDPNHAGSAQTEVVAVCDRVGIKPQFLKSDVEGLFKIKAADAKKLVKQLRELCYGEPELFSATFHYVPIEKWCSSKLEDMKKVVKTFVPGIGAQERWKMQLNKRHFEGESTEIILKLTEVVERSNVDLTSPEKIIQVEIIGNQAGVSLLKPDEYLNVPKMKQQ